jgi:hypothetical protein
MGGWQRMELDDIPSNQYLILDNTSFRSHTSHIDYSKTNTFPQGRLALPWVSA